MRASLRCHAAAPAVAEAARQGHVHPRGSQSLLALAESVRKEAADSEHQRPEADQKPSDAEDQPKLEEEEKSEQLQVMKQQQLSASSFLARFFDASLLATQAELYQKSSKGSAARSDRMPRGIPDVFGAVFGSFLKALQTC